MNLLSEYRKVYENYWLNNPVWGWKRKIMSEVLRYLDMHKWHDLKQDPDDLPLFEMPLLLYLDSGVCVTGHFEEGLEPLPEGVNQWFISGPSGWETRDTDDPDNGILAWKNLDTPDDKVHVK